MGVKKLLRAAIADAFFLLFPSRVATDKRFFSLWERKGFHIVPIHYYEPIPDTTQLKNDLWKKQSELRGIEMNEASQIDLLTAFSVRFKQEYDGFPREKAANPFQYYLTNPSFKSGDAEILYSMIRYYKPKRIVEVGCGFSTLISAQAVLKNKEDDPNYNCKLVAIEPYPNENLKKGFPGLSELKAVEVQDVPFSEFEELEENDILFIDSSHVLRIGGDVTFLHLEVLPRLKKGVIVHCHDIFFPVEYPKEWIYNSHFFWTEQYLFQAFLMFNNSFKVIWAGNYMHLKHPDQLSAAFKSYNRKEERPASFWMRKTN